MKRPEKTSAIEKTVRTIFTETHANQIAEVSFRAGRNEPKPLSGLQSQLLQALIEAEQAHESALTKWSVKHEAYLRDIQIIKAHEAFYNRLRRTIESWQAMDKFAKEDLLRHTQNQLEMIEETNGRKPLDTVRKRCDDTLNAIALAASEKVIRPKGAKSGKSQSVGHANRTERPLHAFISVLQSFWKVNATGQAFTQQFDGDTPLSASARMVVEATKHLHVQYTPSNIRTVMRMLCSDPPKKFPDDEFAFILPRFDY
jgi:hypothetical protein